MQWRPFQSVPINIAGIDSVIEQKYSRPPPSSLDFTITVSADPTWANFADHIGQLERLSPEESVFAFILGAAAAAEGVTTTQEDRDAWGRLFRAVPYKCVPILGAEKQKEAIGLREDLTVAWSLALAAPQIKFKTKLKYLFYFGRMLTQSRTAASPSLCPLRN